MPRVLIAAVAACVAALASGLFDASTHAQERSARLLEIDFTALDASGALVRDLAPEEIDVRIDGRRRTVRAVRRVAAAPAGGAPRVARLPEPYGTSADAASGRVFLIVIDEDSFRAGREQPFRNGVTGLLGDLRSTDYVTVIGMPYGGVKVPLTNDHTRVRHAIEMTAGQRSPDETGSQMACRTRLILESLESILGGMGVRSTPTTVVLLTAGLAAPRRDAPMALAAGMCELQVDLFKRVGVAAGAARANFYIAQPDDLSGGAARLSGESISGTGFLGSDNPSAGIEDLAGVTRAVRLPLTATGTSALARVARETSAYFVAEIESELQDFDARSRRLDLRVDRPGVTVRVRPEITFARARTVDAGTRVTVSDMLTSVATFAELSMRTAAYTLGAADGQVRVALVVEPADRAVALASAGAVLVNDEGAIVARWSAVDAGESPLMGAMLVAPGYYRLRAAAVDAAGRGGAADYRFEARLTPAGSLALGDLVLGLSRDGQLIPRLEFGDEPAALASFEIYGGEEGQAVTAQLDVAATLDGPALVSVPLALRAEGPGRFLAIGTVPLGALPPGDYIVRGMLRLGDGAVGQAIRTLRKTR